MIKALRRKFVVIIMALVGSVLVSVLGGSFISAWQTQHDIITEALDRGIEGDLFNIPRMGERWEDGEQDGRREPKRPNVFVLVVDLDEDGVLLSTNNAPSIIDSNTLASVTQEALKSEHSEVWDDSRHIAWRRAVTDSGWRVVIADTSATDVSLRTLLFKDIGIVVVAMGVLLVIAIGLSTWVLRPVQQAWTQQRRFIADASHELKTPLAVIIANTQILEASPTVTGDDRDWVLRTADEASHMKGLVEELLELARTDETTTGAKGVMKSERIDFSHMVQSASLEFDAIAFERGTRIEEDVELGVAVVGDPDWLERLCKILIDNACKYSKGDRPVEVRLTAEARRCRLSVRNYGNVIASEDLPHVFDRFYRTDKARSRTEGTGGFGLGLAIAKGIAESHGGEIVAASDEEHGTEFSVTLPVVS